MLKPQRLNNFEYNNIFKPYLKYRIIGITNFFTINNLFSRNMIIKLVKNDDGLFIKFVHKYGMDDIYFKWSLDKDVFLG